MTKIYSSTHIKRRKAPIDKKTTALKKEFCSFKAASVELVGNDARVMPRRTLQAIAQSPFPKNTAPMYLNGKLAAIVYTVFCAIPENHP